MKNLYLFEIPIEDYTGDNIFNKQVYIFAENCPSLGQVRDLLKTASDEEHKLSEEYPERGPYLFECDKAIKIIDDFSYLDTKILHSNLVMSSSDTFYSITLQRSVSIYCRLLKPYSIE